MAYNCRALVKLNSLGLVMEKQLIKRKNKRRKGGLVAT
jgi:hypothetical protein